MKSANKGYYEFFCPVKTIAGEAALEHLAFELSSIGCKRPLLITDKGVVGAGLTDYIHAAMDSAQMEFVGTCDDVPPDSSVETVAAIVAQYRKLAADSLVAVGGGSVIDTAKAVNILVSEESDNLAKFSGAGILKHPLKPFFVVPTTAGTGSEVTSVAVIADLAKGVKLPFSSPFLLPNAAIIDPRMTLTLPPHITAATAMDAMTHSIEAFTCLGKNPLSDAYASAAIRLISENLIATLQTPKDKQLRLKLAQASTMAGIAFSNSMVGLVHSLGHATGSVAHLPHGMCMSIFLPFALEYNLEQGQGRDVIGELLLYLAGPEVYAATPKEERPEAAIAEIRGLRDELYALCSLPRTLSETGKVERSQLKRIAELALDDGSIIFNPVEADYEDLLKLLERAY
ncbi:MAG: alcohol dehydrogenase [unclassified Hahellaceae]|nr:alcohol dehydrogenase [Hahellaceae bacterium]|tara:strand:- start:14268 stop:15467 length:1200 start_codon:yes stop_codon:yes gene_type:complete